MLASVMAIVVGLAVLVWSAERFVWGATGLAQHWRLPPLLIGMLVIGFGTSAPELAVSVSAAMQGSPALALGNAYGSNIANIGLILGLTAVLAPIAVHSRVLKIELPLLVILTLGVGWQLSDGAISRTEATVHLALALGLTVWAVKQAGRQPTDALADEVRDAQEPTPPLRWSLLWTVIGLVALVLSARVLVWGAVSVARLWGVDEVIIGLTVVAVGTSLPELAASLAAVRKGAHDLALGNVLGSNLFNLLAVVGLAGVIEPMAVPAGVLARDWWVMFGMTLSLFIVGYGFRGRLGRINRWEGAGLLGAYVVYTGALVSGT
jgi:cation:H+ antiporter